MKKIFLVFLLIVLTLFFSNKAFNTSFAYSYERDSSVLFYKDDYVVLEDDIKSYLENIDNVIIPNSSFLYSDELRGNYDFLIRFALDYVLNNKEYYNEKIKRFSNCLYVDKSGVEKSTDYYIDLDIIYDITDFYFGISGFTIINDDVCVNYNYISLSDYASNEFKFNITDVSVTGNNSAIKALVSYDNGNRYLYHFYNDNNVLKLKNVEVVI